MENVEPAQIAMVGNDGMLGISLFMGGESASSRAVVTSAGHCFSLPADVLEEEFARSGQVMHLLLRLTQVLITQMAQTEACNRHHTLDRQLCRWPRMVLDSQGLAQRCCECYAVVKKEYDGLLPSGTSS